MKRCKLTREQNIRLKKARKVEKPDLIYRLLKMQGLTLTDYCQKHKRIFSTVHNTITGKYRNKDIQDELARELKMPAYILFDKLGDK